MTPTEVTTIITALGILLGALFPGIASVIVAWRTEKKIDDVKAQAEVIAGHVNSAATTSANTITALREQNQLLTALLAESKNTAALLAQAKVQEDSIRASAVPTVPVAPTPAINGPNLPIPLPIVVVEDEGKKDV